MTGSARSNGRIPQDYHTHTNISCDSQATMAEMCQSALDHGISEIAFTEHFDGHPKDSCHMYYNPAQYFANIEAVRLEFATSDLTIRAGVELGEPHRYGDVYAPVLERYPYDVVLGSLHWLGDSIMFDRDYFVIHDEEDVYSAYFTELEQMVRVGGFDVLAHADVFKRVATTVYGPMDSALWETWLRPVWQACIDTGTGIEINTASLRYGVSEVHPAPLALRWYREMGGEILTIGSDSHRPDHVGAALPTALDLAREAGFTKLAIFDRREIVRWEPI